MQPSPSAPATRPWVPIFRVSIAVRLIVFHNEGMPAISRRELFQIAIAADGLHAAPLGLPIGSQTYPHRQRIKDGDFAGLCKDMAALGVESIELCSTGYAEFAS